LAQYLGEAVLHLDVRPVRAAYLVRPGSTTDFKAAIYHACGRWGGLHEVIVPITQKGRIAPRYQWLLKTAAPPDYLFDLAVLADEVRGQVQAKIGKPVLPISTAESVHWDNFHPLGAHESDEIRNIHALVPARPALIDWAGNGLIQDSDELKQWRELGAEIVSTSDRVALAIAQLKDQTVLTTTLHQCYEVLVENPFTMSWVWLGASGSLPDCLWFWNLRAATPRTVERDYSVLTTPDVFGSKDFQEALADSLQRRPHTSTPTFLLGSATIPEDRLERMVRSAGFDVYTGSQTTVSHHLGRGQGAPAIATITVGVNRQPTVPTRTLYGIRASPTVQLFREGTRIRSATPLKAHPLYGHGPVRVRMSGPAQLKAPATPSVAKLFDPRAEWVSGELELAMNHGGSFDIPIAIPSRRAILEAALRDRGLAMQYSQPGKHAQAVLGRLASPDLFLDPNVGRVISALTSQPPAKLLDDLTRTKALSEEKVTSLLASLDVRPPRIERAAREIRQLADINLADALSILDDLAFAGLVERGLVVDCDECGLGSFSGLPTADARAVCPACGARAKFAGDATGPQLHYRLNALLDRASAIGAVGHLYAVAAILQENREALVIPGADITRLDGSSQEVDLIGLAGDLILCGEVKSKAGWFTKTQIERDVGLSAELGAGRHLMVCLTQLSERAIEMAARAAGRHKLALAVMHPPTNRLVSVSTESGTV
jgi:hypothetical protein